MEDLIKKFDIDVDETLRTLRGTFPDKKIYDADIVYHVLNQEGLYKKQMPEYALNKIAQNSYSLKYTSWRDNANFDFLKTFDITFFTENVKYNKYWILHNGKFFNLLKIPNKLYYYNRYDATTECPWNWYDEFTIFHKYLYVLDREVGRYNPKYENTIDILNKDMVIQKINSVIKVKNKKSIEEYLKAKAFYDNTYKKQFEIYLDREKRDAFIYGVYKKENTCSKKVF